MKNIVNTEDLLVKELHDSMNNMEILSLRNSYGQEVSQLTYSLNPNIVYTADKDSRDYVYIEWMETPPKFRGKGYASILINYLKEKFSRKIIIASSNNLSSSILNKYSVINIEEKIIDIKEEVKIGSIILEKGDRIRVLSESVATIIIDQLGGNSKVNAMIGVKQFSDLGNGLGIKFKAKANKGINYIKIMLSPRDTYDVTFGKIRGMEYTVVEEFEDVYADQLKGLIESTTGLYLSL